MRAAAARGLAAPKLPMILISSRRQRAEHGADEPIERGIEAAPRIAATFELRQRQRALGQRLEHQKARPRERASASTTGPAASVRSPAKPAPAPMKTLKPSAVRLSASDAIDANS